MSQRVSTLLWHPSSLLWHSVFLSMSIELVYLGMSSVFTSTAQLLVSLGHGLLNRFYSENFPDFILYKLYSGPTLENNVLIAQLVKAVAAMLQVVGSNPAVTFYIFFQFFQSLEVQNGHTPHSSPYLSQYIDLYITQSPFWYGSDQCGILWENLSFIREICQN